MRLPPWRAGAKAGALGLQQHALVCFPAIFRRFVGCRAEPSARDRSSRFGLNLEPTARENSIGLQLRTTFLFAPLRFPSLLLLYHRSKSASGQSRTVCHRRARLPIAKSPSVQEFQRNAPWLRVRKYLAFPFQFKFWRRFRMNLKCHQNS